VIEAVSGKRFLLVKAGTNPGNFAPYSRAWQIEAEHSFSPKVHVRLNYLVNNSEGIVFLNPQVVKKKMRSCSAATEIPSTGNWNLPPC
jgi:hypothetical protein